MSASKNTAVFRLPRGWQIVFAALMLANCVLPLYLAWGGIPYQISSSARRVFKPAVREVSNASETPVAVNNLNRDGSNDSPGSLENQIQGDLVHINRVKKPGQLPKIEPPARVPTKKGDNPVSAYRWYIRNAPVTKIPGERLARFRRTL